MIVMISNIVNSIKSFELIISRSAISNKYYFLNINYFSSLAYIFLTSTKLLGWIN